MRKIIIKLCKFAYPIVVLMGAANCMRDLKQSESQVASLIPKNALSTPTTPLVKKHYMKTRKPEIEQQQSLTTGSLSGLQPVHLFIADRVPRVGDIITIKIKDKVGQGANQTQKVDATKAPDSTADTKSNPTGGSGKTDDKELEALGNQMPDFNEIDQTPIKEEFKARIIGVDAAGDFIILFVRESLSGYEMRSLELEAKILRNSVVHNEEITTADLYDISWQQSDGRGKEIHREAIAWEPAFTRELSHFAEARSAKDIELEEKRQRLVDIKNRLNQEVKQLADQKKKFVGEREKLQEMQKLAKEDSEAYLKKLQEEKDAEANAEKSNEPESGKNAEQVNASQEQKPAKKG